MRECGGRIIHLKGSRHPRTIFVFHFLCQFFCILKTFSKINRMYIKKKKIPKLPQFFCQKMAKMHHKQKHYLKL
jgi:hypothetical protein